MMEKEKILEILNEHYPVYFDSLEFVRDSGSMAYACLLYTSRCV